MGYKLAGFHMEGFCEIDKRMAAAYQANMTVEHPYVMPVQEFNKMLIKEGVPAWLKNIDVLDGSPPCSSFSMAGNREKDWGKDKKFREGQAKQVLDDLFFHFIETAKLIQPNVVVAENVKGMLLGEAKKYVAEIFLRFDEAGYDTQLFLLDASKMGVPQKRERTFFIARRKNLRMQPVKMEFDEKEIKFKEAIKGIDHVGTPLTEASAALWRRTPPGMALGFAHHKGNQFTWSKLSMEKPAGTATSGPAQLCPDKPAHISDAAQAAIQSFPIDYNYAGSKVRYICGMSVPPLMMSRVASVVAEALTGQRPSRRPKVQRRTSRDDARAEK